MNAAPLVNLVAVPLFSFVTVPFALAGSVGGDWLLRIAAMSLAALQQLLDVVTTLPLAAIDVRELRGAEHLLLLAPLAWAVLPRGCPGRPIAWLGVLALAVHVPERPPHGCADVTVLDVGQGLSVVVTTANESLVYDAGPSYRSGSNAADHVLLPYLRHRGLRPDRFVVSHADLDHSGGAAAVLRDVGPAHVLLGEPADVLDDVLDRPFRC